MGETLFFFSSKEVSKIEEKKKITPTHSAKSKIDFLKN
jgi:hypothetical protein